MSNNYKLVENKSKAPEFARINRQGTELVNISQEY